MGGSRVSGALENESKHAVCGEVAMSCPLNSYSKGCLSGEFNVKEKWGKRGQDSGVFTLSGESIKKTVAGIFMLPKKDFID